MLILLLVFNVIFHVHYSLKQKPETMATVFSQKLFDTALISPHKTTATTAAYPIENTS